MWKGHITLKAQSMTNAVYCWQWCVYQSVTLTVELQVQVIYCIQNDLQAISAKL